METKTDKKLSAEEIHELATRPIQINVIVPVKTHASYGPFNNYDKPRSS